MSAMLTRKEVAARLNVTVQWLKDNATQGPPYYKLSPGAVRYDEDELANWLRQRKARQ